MNIVMPSHPEISEVFFYNSVNMYKWRTSNPAILAQPLKLWPWHSLHSVHRSSINPFIDVAWVGCTHRVLRAIQMPSSTQPYCRVLEHIFASRIWTSWHQPCLNLVKQSKRQYERNLAFSWANGGVARIFGASLFFTTFLCCTPDQSGTRDDSASR